MKKYYILVIAFLSLLMGQNSYAQDYQPLFDSDLVRQLNEFTFTGTNELYEVVINSNSGSGSNYTSNLNYQYVLWLLQQSTFDLTNTDIYTLQAQMDLYQSINPQSLLTWYYDYDGDGYHSQTLVSDVGPGTKWKGLTNGFDCNDNDYTITDECYIITETESLDDSFIITDSSNPNRIVKNQQILVMVNSGSAREASMDMTTSFGGDLTWSGTGVTGNSFSAAYSGSASTSVTVAGPYGLFANGNIQIVDENKISYSSEIQTIGTKINDVSDTFRSFVEAKGSTVTAGTKSCSLTGTIESKNVDMYADGTKYGNATSIDINGTYSMTMPKVKIPIYTAPAVNVFATLDLGSATASLNVNGSLDDSTAAKVDLAGGFELGFTAASGSISATLGNADHFCAEATGTVSVGYFKIGGTVEGNSNATGLLLTPVVKVGNIKADFSVTALVDIGTYKERCELYKDDYEIWPAQDFPYSPIILYQKQ